MSVVAILGMEVPGQLPRKISLGPRSHSDVREGCAPTRSDVRAVAILGMEVPGQLPGILGLGPRAFLK